MIIFAFLKETGGLISILSFFYVLSLCLRRFFCILNHVCGLMSEGGGPKVGSQDESGML